ncbi:MAG TPA: dephospho-CoA kinase [Nocardioidaceae bacterium]|nr:dephospho-CoA kinase [Nocardioidaceae bacterium]
MMRVGLTGGIGSGKSTVGRLLAERGAVVIDSDRLARDVVAPGTPGLSSVVQRFGSEVITLTGELDRRAMAERVFGDAAARADLEAIIHPLVRARAAELEVAAGPGALVVHDIPLLVETGQAERFDVVIVVDVPCDVQLDRLTRLRGMSPEEAKARIGAQASRTERLAAADIVVDNSGSLEELSAVVDSMWEQLSQAPGR